jgi:hypothetical protein
MKSIECSNFLANLRKLLKLDDLILLGEIVESVRARFSSFVTEPVYY